ncbi:MAG: LysM peptidoglycan-binding domain-containing protein [Opitutaceae bacterium]|nr:LysM peptidoglycan-binding domain-containing protein [Opitutaceae bacterium]
MSKCLNVPALLLLGALLWAAGCERNPGAMLGPETDDPNYRRGQQLLRQDRKQEALVAYLKAIETRGDGAPDSHLEAGLLYLQHVKDYIAAIYHLRKYVELRPNSRQADLVRGQIDAATREFARSLPGNPLESKTQRLDMLDQVERLQREIEQLKAELSVARSGGSAPINRLIVPVDSAAGQGSPGPIMVQETAVEDSPITMAPLPSRSPVGEIVESPSVSASPATPPPAPASPAGRRHTVARGDTLFSLAQQYYGNRSRWRDIYEANRNQLPDANSLRLGMELVIP